jgi:hypothetical protein
MSLQVVSFTLGENIAEREASNAVFFFLPWLKSSVSRQSLRNTLKLRSMIFKRCISHRLANVYGFAIQFEAVFDSSHRPKNAI